MRFERYLECEHCHYARSSEDDGRQFDELDPKGPPGRAGDPLLLCLQCIKKYDFQQCECCQAWFPELPYMSRNSVCYCQGCYDYGCDLQTCERPEYKDLPPVPSTQSEQGRTLRWKRDKYGNVIRQPAFNKAPRPGSENDGPTEEELRETYASLGYEYHMNTIPEEGK